VTTTTPISAILRHSTAILFGGMAGMSETPLNRPPPSSNALREWGDGGRASHGGYRPLGWTDNPPSSRQACEALADMAKGASRPSHALSSIQKRGFAQGRQAASPTLKRTTCTPLTSHPQHRRGALDNDQLCAGPTRHNDTHPRGQQAEYARPGCMPSGPYAAPRSKRERNCHSENQKLKEFQL
jgi:hypothetical protein